MIPAILAQLGLPLLVKAVGSVLGALDNPAAKAASQALTHVDEALSAKSITPSQVAEANRHMERLAELDTDHAKTALAEINATFRAEVTADDAYVRRWRPTFGYAVAITWTATMLAVAAAIIETPDQAPSIIAALVNTSVLWGIALGVLGISVVKRSHDKALGQNSNQKGAV